MKSKRRGKISGAVLIMVLTVMFVLIIMLMATLTVVTTAGKRIYTKYEENQAYYTARSALDVFAGNMLNDSTYNYSTSPTAGDVTQGCKIQEQLYTVIVHNGATEATPQGDGTPAPVSAKKNVNIYGSVDKDYLEYKISLPTLANSTESGAENYGNFGDDDEITIRIEVVDRLYDAGEDGIIGNSDDQRKKDAMTVKVTSTSTVMGVDSTAAAIYESKKPAANNATRAVTVTGGGEMNARNLDILGGIAAPVSLKIGNDPKIWGNTYIGNGFDSAVALHARATKGEWVYLRGKKNPSGGRDPITLNNGMDIIGDNTGGDATTVPNVIVDGDMSMSTTSFTYGASGYEVRMVVNGDIIYTGASTLEVWSDLYVTGDITLAGSSHLIVHGNYYSGGTNTFTTGGSSVTVDGDIYVTNPSAIIPQTDSDGNPVNLTVRGDVGALAMTHVHSSAALPVTIKGLQTPGKSLDVVEDELAETGGYIEINWDGPLFKLETEGLLFGIPFFRYSDMNEGTVTASEYAFLSEEDLDKLKDPTTGQYEYPADYKRIHEYIADKEAAGLVTTVQMTPGGSITAPGKYRLKPPNTPFNGSVFTIDAGGEVEVFLEPGSYDGNNAKIIVETGTTVRFLAEPGAYYFKMPIVTREFENKKNAGAPIYAGQYGGVGPGTSLLNIPISFYFEGESNIVFDTNAIFVGYIYAPRASVGVTASGGMDVPNMYYNGISFGTARGLVVAGSLLCRNFCGTAWDPSIPPWGANVADPSNAIGDGHGSVAFVKATEISVSGIPQLTFEPVVYTRR